MPDGADLKKFFDAMESYRSGVIDGSFPSFEKTVKPTISAAKLAEAAAEAQGPSSKASYQQAVDIMSAAERAIDMRKMSYRDYVAAATSSAAHRGRYEQSRLQRFESGGF